jgi:hypothetical protein
MAKIESIIGKMPYRLAFAGGWIDQPFISEHNPDPPGSMVVVSLNPTFPFMPKCGLGTSTRQAAIQLWGNSLPDEDPQKLMRQLYNAENADRTNPSGSQDMAGIIYPGISRLDYDARYEGGYFPTHVESNNRPQDATWLENIIYILPVNQRPQGYYPLGEKNLDPEWIKRLGNSGKECFDAITEKDSRKLGWTMNETMRCWEVILPHVVRHPTITMDLMGLLAFYQSRYQGAMYSGCGGGYFYIVSEEPVPGTFQVSVRISPMDKKNAE